MKVIEVRDLRKNYGDVTAVNNISFSADKGQLIGFLGVNGAGKSTTINMMYTMLTPTSGFIQICGHDVRKDSREVRRDIGIVYQNNVLDDLLSVRENLICRGVLHGLSRRKADARLRELCSLFSIEQLLSKKYRTLSGGQKRRCEIAAALMHTPEILFLDEPTTGLDPAARFEVWEMVKDLQEKTNMTVFLTTHYMEEAAKADKIIIISKGSIIAEGKPHELKEKYAFDRLKIYCGQEQKAKFAEKLAGYEYSDESYGIRVKLGSSHDAIPLLGSMSGYDGFEVIRGTLDDVFLNITKEGK